MGETEFYLSAIPLGGYVEIAGLAEPGQGDQLHATHDDNKSFQRKSYLQKLLIIGGGIIMNLLFSFSLIALLITYISLPATPLLAPIQKATVKTVDPTSLGAKIGLREGDQIITINGINVEHRAHLLPLYTKIKSQPLVVTYLHDKELKTSVIPSEEHEGKELGITFDHAILPPQGFLNALVLSWQVVKAHFLDVFSSFKHMFVHRNVKDLGGPIMIVNAITHGVKKSFPFFLILLAFISTNLAALNLIPLPIFDGGQALIITIETIMGHELPEKIRYGIALVSWGLIILLMLLLSIKDLIRIFI